MINWANLKANYLGQTKTTTVRSLEASSSMENPRENPRENTENGFNDLTDVASLSSSQVQRAFRLAL